MRLILCQPPQTRSEPLRQRLGWTSLHQRRHLAFLKQVHRYINKRAPVYPLEKFQTNSNFGYCGTRGEGKLHLKRPLSDFYRSSFEFQGAFHFNRLLLVLEHYLVQKLLLLHIKKFHVNNLFLNIYINCLIYLVFVKSYCFTFESLACMRTREQCVIAQDRVVTMNICGQPPVPGWQSCVCRQAWIPPRRAM